MSDHKYLLDGSKLEAALDVNTDVDTRVEALMESISFIRAPNGYTYWSKQVEYLFQGKDISELARELLTAVHHEWLIIAGNSR